MNAKQQRPTVTTRTVCTACDGLGFDRVDFGWPQECAGCAGSGFVEREVGGAYDFGASPARAHDDEATAAADEWEATAWFLAWALFVVLVVVCVEQWPAIRGFVARWQP